MTAFVANSNVLQLVGLKGALDGAWVNNATVTATVKDDNGNSVTGAVGLTMTYVSGSNGNYSVLLGAALPFKAGAVYRAFIDVDAGGRIGHWEFPFRPLTRTTK